ncbi:cysteine hydrolase family protein [Flagellimonas zhangzhouensis]|uniref:Nicotinamidase-related amidase n=1 Tax=Flagellimonas zhangzhouensis TaxID=1073328 RepID=A0A1H2V8R0_9FLAO|nr:cysteine hydrolase family protein [Allomuricauda zhangzhouensis]SDQ09753.1 Nicotinamidase-related amidase [Allomuricauda zhangzhouensis]SDW64736.1 Nicotinamidase-related amidase [Allomuricauda zhangzhouensis]
MTALVLIDIQKGLQEMEFYGTERNNPEAEENCIKLLAFFRAKQIPVFHVKHNSKNEDSPLFPGKMGNDFHPAVKPLENEPIFEKNVNSAFIGTELEARLKTQNITHLVIAGLTIEHCISTSVRMAANLGFNVTLSSDATAAFDKIGIDGKRYSSDIIFQTEMANLKDEFATIQCTSALLEELDN